MVGKLLLAAQEQALRALAEGSYAAGRLVAAYREIRAGLGHNKSPREFGAFPTDPYSHTPSGLGARQPGMTGLVKEEILARCRELGLVVQDGELRFDPALLQHSDLLVEPARMRYLAVDNNWRVVNVPARSVGFTVCQVPVILTVAGRHDNPAVHIQWVDGRVTARALAVVDAETARHIFLRDGEVQELHVVVTGQRSQ